MDAVVLFGLFFLWGLFFLYIAGDLKKCKFKEKCCRCCPNCKCECHRVYGCCCKGRSERESTEEAPNFYRKD